MALTVCTALDRRLVSNWDVNGDIVKGLLTLNVNYWAWVVLSLHVPVTKRPELISGVFETFLGTAFQASRGIQWELGHSATPLPPSTVIQLARGHVQQIPTLIGFHLHVSSVIVRDLNSTSCPH